MEQDYRKIEKSKEAPKFDTKYYIKAIKKIKKYDWHITIYKKVTTYPLIYKKFCSGVIRNIYPKSFEVVNPNSSYVIQYSGLVCEDYKYEVLR